MEIKEISTDDIRKMDKIEGLVLQGCGGSPEEWVNGINELLGCEDILLDSTKFECVYTFEHDGLTNILFPFSEDVKLNIGKFAVWRLNSYNVFGGTWLSDYVPNRLGGFNDEEPDCEEGMDVNL